MGLFSKVTKTISRAVSNPVKTLTSPTALLGVPGALASAAMTPKTGATMGPAAGAGGGAMVGTQVMPDVGMGTRGVNAQLSYDAQGRPVRNNFQTILDDKGSVQPNFSLAGKTGPDVALNTQSADLMRSKATAQGPSTWANLAEQSQRMEQSNALNQNNVSAQAGMNRGFNQLAARGGLSAGQRERLAMSGQRQQFGGQQNILNQGMQSRLNIGQQDEVMKNQLLGQSQQADLQSANFMQNQRIFNNDNRKFDIGNALSDVRGLNAYNSGSYSDAMREWGAAKTADAQARSAANQGGGSIWDSLF